MKTLLLIVIVMFFEIGNLHAQDAPKKYFLEACMKGYKIQPSTVVLLYFSGFFNGYRDVLTYHYSEFKRHHSNANDQFWNPAISWTNKYKNHDPAQGPKFWGSTTIFVPVTDANHATESIGKYCMIAAIVIKIGEKRKPFKFYLMDAFLYTVAYNAGFWTTYELIYAPPKP